ncbi:ImmA/IrrE family metallo-endopeptidase [Trueperella pyogenes]|uniref:ImmA/IrrE family metallo-endopeptidase n=1 Tax=Trueperella pyogenes TaxID=1661 RepID=UPI00312B7C9E
MANAKEGFVGFCSFETLKIGVLNPNSGGPVVNDSLVPQALVEFYCRAFDCHQHVGVIRVTVHVKVAPEVLLWAAERAGCDERKIEQHAPKFHNWVSGVSDPTLKQIEDFSRATYTPLPTFFLPEPPAEALPIPDMRTLGNKAIVKPSANLLDVIYLCQARQDWYREYAEELGIDAVAFIGSATIDTRPENVARDIRRLIDFDLEERRKFGTWTKALRALIDQIEDTGVLVMVSGIVGSNTHRKLNPEEFRGFALSDSRAPLVFVNGADTKAAQIFTLIHEFAHLWLGHSALSDALMSHQSSNTEEIWCNRVAAEVLLPLSDLRREYSGTPETKELERLARQFKVSTLVVLKRIYDAQLLSWDDYQKHYEVEHHRVVHLAKEQRSHSGGDYYKTQPLRLSRQFARAVVESTFAGSTSFRDAYALLGTKKHSTFENLAETLGAS